MFFKKKDNKLVNLFSTGPILKTSFNGKKTVLNLLKNAEQNNMNKTSGYHLPNLDL